MRGTAAPDHVSDTLQITEIPVEGYERVVRGVDPQSGLHAIIAVHDTTLGPALGGLRMWNYASEQEALFDVERLAKGMSYKSAVARTGLGGGKGLVRGAVGHRGVVSRHVRSFGRTHAPRRTSRSPPRGRAAAP